ncbi:MAG: putative integral rane protein [Nocardioides sp.]|nr:putative integral rane protein [Nocardioides sp.]
MSSPSEERTPHPVAQPPGHPAGVIHDMGYRPYAGPRLGERAVAWSFFRTGLRNTFGLGRSGRSKVLPMILLGVMLLPALILVGVLVQAKDLLGLDEQIVAYSTYPITTQLLISVFVASQAPALISRDLRFRTITLYLARPMPRSSYVLVRLASLTVATFALIAAPLVLMYVGGLLADLPVGRETGRFLGAVVGAALLAACLAGPAALVAALTIRRGLAVAAVIVVLLVSYTVVATIQGISYDSGHDTVGQVAGIFSPYTLVNGVQVFLFDSPAATPTPPVGTAMGVTYLLATLVTVLGSVGALLARYRKVAP